MGVWGRSPPNALGVPPPLLSPPDTTDGVEMGRYLKRAACMSRQSSRANAMQQHPSPHVTKMLKPKPCSHATIVSLFQRASRQILAQPEEECHRDMMLHTSRRATARRHLLGNCHDIGLAGRGAPGDRLHALLPQPRQQPKQHCHAGPDSSLICPYVWLIGGPVNGIQTLLRRIVSMHQVMNPAGVAAQR